MAYIPTTKTRVNFYISREALNILSKSARFAGVNKSNLIDQLIKQKLTDPRETLRDRAKDLARELHTIQERITELDEMDISTEKATDIITNFGELQQGE